MAVVPITKAAKLAGIGRSTLYRMVDEGKISKSDDGIEVSELIRVFGEKLKMTELTAETKVVEPVAAEAAPAPKEPEPNAAVLQERVRGLESVIDELRAQLQAKEAELRARLQDKEDLIEDLRGQVRLLVMPLLTAPESAQRPERRGILQRIFGRG